jgi:tetratricopeptide (TPR) repeat protein
MRVEAQMTCKEFACLVDRYLCGELTADTQETFELHYFECDDCFTRLKIAERLLAKEVPMVVESRRPVFLGSMLWTWKPFLAAATVLFVVFSSILLLRHSSRMRVLYGISAFSPPVYLTSETRGPETDEIVARAMVFYNRGDYSQALALLKGIANPAQNHQVVFFKGVCFLLTDALKKSVREFDVIIEAMNPSYYDEAIYYKAIALLRLNKKQEALEQLNHLAGMFSPYAARAKALLVKVSQI